MATARTLNSPRQLRMTGYAPMMITSVYDTNPLFPPVPLFEDIHYIVKDIVVPALG